MDVYFVANKNTADKTVIQNVKPERILLSYFYFKNTNLGEFYEELGYRPFSMLDSGAYSAWTKNKNISPIDYMNYIMKNNKYIDKYIALDVIGDPELTVKYYEIMKLKGFNPIPVYHFGSDENYLKLYIKEGNSHIALGNTVPIMNKKKVAEWANYLIEKYPDVKFHLLGSSSKEVTQGTNLDSCDSSSWIMMAVNGYPKEIKGRDMQSKIKRAEWQMRKILEENNG